jgi:hypothetical protein
MAYVDQSIREVVDINYHFEGSVTLRSLTGIQNIFDQRPRANGGGPFPPVDPTLKTPHNSFRPGQLLLLFAGIRSGIADDQPFRWVLGPFGNAGQHS